MQYRAAIEQQNFQITQAWFTRYIGLGVRLFFGVEVTPSGHLIKDNQRPDLYKRYTAYSVRGA
jgi:uncharacterized metal-binding protein